MRTRTLAATTALLTFVLIVLGGVVHGTGSSLACPDWPLCNGTAFPRMTGGVEFEHSHRLVALTVTVLVSLLALRARRAGGGMDARARRWAFAALGLVVVQASLGALTVVLRLPPAVSIAHLATSMCVLSSLVLLAVESDPPAPPVPDGAARVRTWLGLAVLGAFAQIVLGAVVRHTGAALACTTVPWCSGAVWPDDALPRIQMLHRGGALVAALLVSIGSRVAWARLPPGSGARRLALVPPAIVGAQIALGVAVIVGGAPLALVSIHLAAGTALLGSLVALWGRFRPVRVERESVAPSPSMSGGDAPAPRPGMGRDAPRTAG